MQKHFLISCLLFLTTAAQSLWAKDTINLAITNLPPFQIVENMQAKDCINIRVLKKILDPMNIEINYQVMPFKRCLVYLETGKSDIFMGILRHPEREEYMHYVEPPYKLYSSKAFFLKKGNAQLLQKYEDLHKLKIGVRLGFKYFQQFDNDENLNKDAGSNNELNFKKLDKGRIDALAITEITGDYLTALYGYDFEKASFKYTHRNPAYLVISKKSKFMKRLKEFEFYSQQAVDKNTYEKVEKAFLSEIKSRNKQ